MCRALYAHSCIMCILYCILFFGMCIIIIIMRRKKKSVCPLRFVYYYFQHVDDHYQNV